MPFKHQNTFFTLASDSCDSSLHMHPPLNLSAISVCFISFFGSYTHLLAWESTSPLQHMLRISLQKSYGCERLIFKKKQIGNMEFGPLPHPNIIKIQFWLLHTAAYKHIMGKRQCHLHFFYLNILRQPFKKKKTKTLRNVPSLFWTACILQLI